MCISPLAHPYVVDWPVYLISLRTEIVLSSWRDCNLLAFKRWKSHKVQKNPHRLVLTNQNLEEKAKQSKSNTNLKVAFNPLKLRRWCKFLISKNRQNKGINRQYDVFGAQNHQVWQLWSITINFVFEEYDVEPSMIYEDIQNKIFGVCIWPRARFYSMPGCMCTHTYLLKWP